MPLKNACQTLLSTRSLRAGRRILLASTLLVLGTEGLQNAVANGDTRTLTIHHTHSGEDIVVTFKRDGRYDDAALAKLNHFLRDWRNQDQTKMDPRLFDVVWEVYQDVGGTQPIQIISAYRSPATNAMLRRRSRGVAQFSQHMLGKAMDFNIPGVPLEQVRAAGLRMQRGGVGFYPTSGSPFVHVDVGSIRHWPRMSRDQLVRVFPNGRTVHVPSDGQPLSGYALALADVQRRGGTPSHTSVAAARGAGIEVADAGETEKSKPGFFSKLFGTGKSSSDDDDEADSKPAGSARREIAKQELASTKVAAVSSVPMPRSRPGQREAAKPEAQITVAEADVAAPVPMPVPAPARVATPAPAPTPALFKTAAATIDANAAKAAVNTTTPAQIVESRGVWRAEARQFADTTPVRQSRKPQPQRYEVASAEPTVLPRFPGQPEDEKPTERLLAFAPTNDPMTGTTTATRTRKGGLPTIVRSANASIVPRTTQSVRDARQALAKSGDNPWLRGVLLSPSIHTAMGVSSMGLPNYRELASLIRKPIVTIAMTFVDEPESLDTLEFRGSAITNVPTIAFGDIVASGH